MLFDTFQAFVEKNELIAEGTTTLLALSGGIDSVVLAHLLAQSKYSFACAHINFQLRGADSAEDAAFCKQLANHLDVPYFHISIDTLNLAKKKGNPFNWLPEIFAMIGFEK